MVWKRFKRWMATKLGCRRYEKTSDHPEKLKSVYWGGVIDVL